jgi:hypothetical protein
MHPPFGSGVGGYKGAVNSRGVPHGRGAGVDKDGDHYEGDWVDGRWEGMGKVVYASGDKYEGYLVNYRREGKGTMVYVGGSRYVGAWAKDAPNGAGVLTDRNGAVLFEGQWVGGLCLFLDIV